MPQKCALFNLRSLVKCVTKMISFIQPIAPRENILIMEKLYYREVLMYNFILIKMMESIIEYQCVEVVPWACVCVPPFPYNIKTCIVLLYAY